MKYVRAFIAAAAVLGAMATTQSATASTASVHPHQTLCAGCWYVIGD